MKRVLGGYNLDGVMAVNWGVVNEAEGVKAFVEAYQVTVLESGLFVSESGVLGASPDGLVQPSALLEVKCPHSQRNKTITEAVQSPSYLREEGGSYVQGESPILAPGPRTAAHHRPESLLLCCVDHEGGNRHPHLQRPCMAWKSPPPGELLHPAYAPCVGQ